jgi:hypothetical protein
MKIVRYKATEPQRKSKTLIRDFKLPLFSVSL